MQGLKAGPSVLSLEEDGGLNQENENGVEIRRWNYEALSKENPKMFR